MSTLPVTRTTCPYCGVGCGLIVTADEAGTFSVRGDESHPANFGRICSKGAALGETLSLDGRLLTPEIEGRPCDWASALDLVATRFSEVIAQHGPEAVAFYVSGQLLTEDYYVANKLMKGFIGSGNIDTNSRLCMSSSVAGHKRAFGADTVPCSYTDLEQADLITLVGSNTAWCHPVLFQRIRDEKKRRPQMRVVVIDPRRTATCDIADLHLPLKPGSDIALFNGLLAHLKQAQAFDDAFIEAHTSGLSEALQAAQHDQSPQQSTALAAEALACFYDWFTTTERAITIYSQGVNQWAFGTDKVNAIINCHLATGRIGKAGAGPFSLTGQPNAMGGREVGGLANQLAAHMDFAPEDVARVARFWQAPTIATRPGLKAAQMFEAIHSGKIKALWIMATNPAVSMPDANRIRSALKACDFLVVSDCVRNTDTTQFADILLPATAWGEKEGMVTNSERRLSRQRPFLPPPGSAKPDWWIINQVAQRMGYGAHFDYQNPYQIFIEHAQLSGYENRGQRDFDISALSHLTEASYNTLEPIQWPAPEHGGESAIPLFSEGRFYHADGRARFIATQQQQPARLCDTQYPLVLNSGRIRDQWHTMTRTGKTPRLTTHIAEPFVQIHPTDAQQYQLVEGALAEVVSDFGRLLGRVHIDPDQQPGSLFAPIHWSEQFARHAAVGAVVNPLFDPVSGQPGFKHTPVSIRRFEPLQHLFILSREAIQLPNADYQVRIPARGHIRYELALTEPIDLQAYANNLFENRGEWLVYRDDTRSIFRAVHLQNSRLNLCLFSAATHQLPERSWLAGCFGDEPINTEDRSALLAARPGPNRPNAGPTLCSCFNVGYQTILDAISEQSLISVEQISAALKAGSNCGSCIPEIRKLLSTVRHAL